MYVGANQLAKLYACTVSIATTNSTVHGVTTQHNIFATQLFLFGKTTVNVAASTIACVIVVVFVPCITTRQFAHFATPEAIVVTSTPLGSEQKLCGGLPINAFCGGSRLDKLANRDNRIGVGWSGSGHGDCD